MDNRQRMYAAIDLKSFYASVECCERGLDPLTTNLVVADESRTQKTICLAVSPSLKSHGIGGRPRLFEVIERVKEINAQRKAANGGQALVGSSYDDTLLRSDPTLALDYIVAKPQMAHYIEISSVIFATYLKYVAPEDIYAYSIDEVFIDVTPYLKLYGKTVRELVITMVRDVLATTGITATAGIGTNMYLAKVAMDIVAKHLPADDVGMRIAELDEKSYRRQLWCHRPLTDFWRVGHGYAQKLEANNMFTMGDIARRSLEDEDLLYKLFGVNAEYLIDHAWGVEPTTIAEVKSYAPKSSSTGSGQVLPEPYTAEKLRIVAREMTEALSLDLVEKGLVTDQLTLTVIYDISNLKGERGKNFHGDVATDYYGRTTPKHAHGTAKLDQMTSSTRLLCNAMLELFDRIVDPKLLARRLFVTASHVVSEGYATEHPQEEQLNLFTDYEALERQREAQQEELNREHKLSQQIIEIKERFGKNAILRGTSFQDGARAKDRNSQIGGHKA